MCSLGLTKMLHRLKNRFLFKLTGNDEEINLLGDGTEKPEFGNWSWMSPEQIIDLVGVYLTIFTIIYKLRRT